MSEMQQENGVVAQWPVSPEPKEPQHSVWMGPYGLRAGWGILLYLVMAIVVTMVIAFSIMAAQGKLHMTPAQKQAQIAKQEAERKNPKPIGPKGTTLNEALQFGALLAAAVAIAAVERRKLGVYGVGTKHVADIVPGALVGVVALSVLVGALRALHLVVFDARYLSGSAMWLYGLKWMLAFFFVGCFEEYLLRGYLQYTLTRGLMGAGKGISMSQARGWAFAIATLILSTVFAIGHLWNPGENWFGIFMVFLAGVVFSYALWKTGSLWWGIGFHMTWDWAQSFLYGVPDSGNLSVGRLFQTHPVGAVLMSGGSDGPEGSVLVVPVLLGVMLLLWMMPQREQPEIGPTA